MTVTVNWLQAESYNAGEWRRVIAAMLAKSSPTTARDGVLAGLAVRDGASGMDVIVGPGNAVVAGYLVTNTADTTLTLDAGGAVTRTDVIALQVLDQESGDASSAGQLIVVKGTSGTEPAIPARSIKLATVSVSAGANTLTGSALTDGRGFTGGAGPIPAPGRLAVGPFSLVDYSMVYDDQAQQLGVNVGAAWRKFYNTAQVDAAIAAKVAAAVLETTRSTATIDVQGQWDQINMVNTLTSIGSGWSTPGGWTQVGAQGWYSITGGATFGANTNGQRRGIGFVDANGTMLGTPLLIPAAAAGNTILSHTIEVWRPAGSQVRMVLWQDAAASMNVTDLRMTVRLAIVGS